MNREQEELQFIGFCGIWREYSKLVFTWHEIFFHVGLALTIPFLLIFVAHTEIRYEPSSYEAARRAAMELATYILVQAYYTTFLLIDSRLSTFDVLSTVASVSLSKSLTLKEAKLVVSKDWERDWKRFLSKVWKRLMETFVCVVAILFVYNFVVVLLAYPISLDDMGTCLSIGLAISLLCSLGHSYMSVTGQLAKTISVLELESNGVQALREIKLLKKAKMGISVGIFLLSCLCVGGALYNTSIRFVVVDLSNGEMLAVFCLLSSMHLFCLNSVGMVVHTRFRLECKFDKTALADHLEV